MNIETDNKSSSRIDDSKVKQEKLSQNQKNSQLIDNKLIESINLFNDKEDSLNSESELLNNV